VSTSGCSLTGGETAIMPGFYEVPKNGEAQYDLAGFAVGVVERKKMITGKKIKSGHLLLGLASTGFHSNGYSLLRKVFTPAQLKGKEGKELLKPTQIYVKPIRALMDKVTLEGVVNITGGGVIDNLPRIIPSGLAAMIDTKSWQAAKIFETVKSLGKIDAFEMYRTFNMGIGMVVILKDSDVISAQKILSQFKIKSWVIGEVAKATQGQAPVQLF
jgi:phosphoribosylformylglycinamidine cyclo-ligase